VNFPTPVIDGKLDEAVWKVIPGFEIKWNDTLIRAGYPSTGPFRSGQYQPTVNGGTANVVDPADAMVKMFFKADTLYLGVDISDKIVQFSNSYDRYDGIIFTILDRLATDPIDHSLLTRKLTVIVDSAKGNPTKALDYMLTLRDSLKGAKVVLRLNSGTTVDTLGVKADSGYVIEMAISLTALGYPPGRGDGIAFLGLDLLDGDSFVNAVNSYGTRTWWFREHDGSDGPAFCYMDPTAILTDVARTGVIGMPTEFALLGNYPNPFNPSTSIRYAMPQAGSVVLTVYDMLGRSVSSHALGTFSEGEHSYTFNGSNLSSGVYFYQLRMVGASTGKEFSTPYAKMTLVK
jgi:hypothetical protein